MFKEMRDFISGRRPSLCQQIWDASDSRVKIDLMGGE